jgi:hypothetical protein
MPHRRTPAVGHLSFHRRGGGRAFSRYSTADCTFDRCNNTAGAIAAYLTTHRLDGYASTVVGRPYARPELMKPDSGPVLAAVQQVGATPAACVLVGDAMSDIVAARVPMIAYANRPS